MVAAATMAKASSNLRFPAALRQPGSSFKILHLCAGHGKGMTPDSPIVDAPILLGHWNPKNLQMALFRPRRHEIRFRTARSTPSRSGSPRTSSARTRSARSCRLQREVRRRYADPPRMSTIPIGTSEVTVLDQATAYAVFPAAASSRAVTAFLRSSTTMATCSMISPARATGERVLSQTANDYMESDADPCSLCRHAPGRCGCHGVLTGRQEPPPPSVNPRCPGMLSISPASSPRQSWFGNDD